MSDIFVSYSRLDASVVSKLVDKCKEQGWTVSWDQEIPIGHSWHDHLKRHLGEARCVLVVWSSASVESRWVLEEAEFAGRRGLQIIPVRIDDIEPPLGFLGIQAANLIGWDGRSTFPGFQKLLRDLAGILGSANPLAVPAAAHGHEGQRHEERGGQTENLPSACLRTLTGHRSSVNALAFSPDGRLLASGAGGGDHTIKVWYLEGAEVHTFTGHTGAVNALAFSPDGRVIASGGQDGTARIWEVRTGREQYSVSHGSKVTSIGFSPDGRLVASGSLDGAIKLWASDSGSEVRSLKQGGWTWGVYSVAFSPHGRMLAVGDTQAKIKFWEVETGRELRTLIGHGGGGFWAGLMDVGITVAFSPDGRLLASGSPDNTGKLWDSETGRELRTLRHSGHVYAVAFSPCGSFIATGGRAEPSLKLWEVAGGSELRALSHQGAVHAVAFSASDRSLASGGSDGAVRLWG